MIFFITKTHNYILKKDARLIWQYQSTKLHNLKLQETAQNLTERMESPLNNKNQLQEAPLRNWMEITGFPVDAEKSLRKKTSFISQDINKIV